MLIVEGDETVRSLTILEKESHLIITYEQHFVQGELPQKKKTSGRIRLREEQPSATTGWVMRKKRERKRGAERPSTANRTN